MSIGDIIVVIDNETLPTSFMGRYGRIVDGDDYKVLVEFNMPTGRLGRLCHTAKVSDLKKVGEANF